MSKSPLEHLELVFGSEIPTERAPERAALAARKAIAKLAKAREVTELCASDLTEVHASDAESWFDSEAPTNVAAERPLLPRPPRSPKL